MKKIYSKEQCNYITKRYSEGAGSPTIAKELGLKTGSDAYWIKKNIGLRSCKEATRKYSHNDNYFNTIDSAEKAYWLGFIYADGYITKGKYSKYAGVTLSITDKTHLEKLKKALHATNPIKEYHASSSNYSDNNYCRLLLTVDKMYDDLQKHGVFERKTNIIKPPTTVKDEYISHFIRGYFDGDGCHTHYIQHTHSGTCHTRCDSVKILGTMPLLKWIEEKILEFSNQLSNGMYKRKKEQTVYSLEYRSVTKTFYILNFLYKDADIYLDRKFNHYCNMLSFVYSRRFLKRSPLKSLELSGKPLELAMLQQSDEKHTNANA